MADCAGNAKHSHDFRYFGTPDTYKVFIMNKDTGKQKTSDVINRKDFNSRILDRKMLFGERGYFKPYCFVFGIGEGIVLLTEYGIYHKLLENADKHKKIKYVAVANLITAFLTFGIYFY